MTDIKWKAIIIGFGAYILAWIVWNLVIGSLLSVIYNSEFTASQIFVFQVFNLLVAVIPGYVAARIAKVRPIAHGVIAGIPGGAGLHIFWTAFGVYEKSSLSAFLFMPVILVIMSYLGGVVANWQLQRQ